MSGISSRPSEEQICSYKMGVFEIVKSEGRRSVPRGVHALAPASKSGLENHSWSLHAADKDIIDTIQAWMQKYIGEKRQLEGDW